MTGLFDFQARSEDMQRRGTALNRIHALINFELFRARLESIRAKSRDGSGRPAYDVVVMFKILVIQALYCLSDVETEWQLRDRISFLHFAGFQLNERTPDSNTIRNFREQLKEAGIFDALFMQFEEFLLKEGFAAAKGQIIDASIIEVPRQRMTRKQKELIKDGEIPPEFKANRNMLSQKDLEARGTLKRDTYYFGFKNHINVDAEHKLIRAYIVTPASVHDSQCIEQLVDKESAAREVYADSAYRSEAISAMLAESELKDQIHRKGYRNHPLSEAEKAVNLEKSKIRARIEHVFGRQFWFAEYALIRGIGLLRIAAKVALSNLLYNFLQYGVLMEKKAVAATKVAAA